MNVENIVAVVAEVEELVDAIVIPSTTPEMIRAVEGGFEASRDLRDLATRKLLELRLALDAEHTRQLLEGAPVLVQRADLVRLLALVVAYVDDPDGLRSLGPIVARINTAAGCNL